MNLSKSKICRYMAPIVAGIVLFLPVMVHALDFSGDGKIDIVADELSYDKVQDSVNAKGNVRITSGNTTLTTESLIYLQKKQTAIVTEGFLLSTEDGDTITGEEIEYSFKDGTGSMTAGKIFIKKDNYHIWGDSIEKVGENRFKVRGASFTTCEGEYPSWMVKSSKIDVEIGEYLFADHARLYLKKIPVIYTPKLIVPVKTERQTGLLPPKAGYSSKYGFTYEQPFFWAISMSRDATITLDYEGNRGVGGDLEYRYVRSADSRGEIDFKYMDEREPVSDERWEGRFRHLEDFSNGMYGRVNLNAVSDRDFFLDYAEDSDLYTSQWLESKASLMKNWQDYSLLTELRYFKNLLVAEETTLQRLPEVTFTAKRKRVGGGPFYSRMETRLTNFWRERDNEPAGLYSGQRLDINPSISLPLTPGNIFELTPTLGVRETIYHTDEKDDSWQSREMYDLNVDFLIPLSRVYSYGGSGIEKVKHTIEPGLTYSYIPDEEQSDLPYYDGIDGIGRRNNIRLKMNNYLVTKRVDEAERVFYHKLVDFKLFADYDIHEADRALSSPTDKKKPWGPVTGKLKVAGEKAIRLESEVRYDTYLDRVSYLSAYMESSYKRIELLKLSYRYALDPEVKYWDAAARFKVSDSIKLAYSGRYSVLDHLFLESKYGIMMTRQCWSVALTYSEREFPEERKFYVVFNLKGLGDIGDRGDLF